ncbi:hypothetical protein HD598_000429 [Neomicrococcus aestuarii]|uniref:Uncharacterized protein n=1 Tax=Neomicrococcus aestuarii TaxID=556325 RepID=A0A7W8TRS6_9MICC|nr:hypothetical protein [Neomicrococcus aestuarii]
MVFFDKFFERIIVSNFILFLFSILWAPGARRNNSAGELCVIPEESI